MNNIAELGIKRYTRDGVGILRDIQWTIHRGEHWVVLGPNGAGKSSLLGAVSGYDWHCQGTLTVLGQDYGACDMRALRARIGVASAQMFEWLPKHQSAVQVVASGLTTSIGDWYVPTDADLSKAAEALRMIGAETLVSRRYGVLSQGERQRVMIARALVTKPALLILDEPCAGLDPGARERLLQDIDQLCSPSSEQTVILSSHHLEEIPPSLTHAMLLKDGQVIAAGKLSEVITEDNLERLYDFPGRIDLVDKRYRWIGRWA